MEARAVDQTRRGFAVLRDGAPAPARGGSVKISWSLAYQRRRGEPLLSAWESRERERERATASTSRHVSGSATTLLSSTSHRILLSFG
eukprot:2247280-Pyramimonas_sp.AAC.1